MPQALFPPRLARSERPTAQSDPSDPTKTDKTITKLTKTDHPDRTISSPQQEIVESKAQQEKIPAETAHPPDQPEYDHLIEEVFDEFPHLRGQSTEQILQFLDQLTDPDGQASDIPTEIYAEAAG